LSTVKNVAANFRLADYIKKADSQWRKKIWSCKNRGATIRADSIHSFYNHFLVPVFVITMLVQIF
jgi:hypothetical protein